MKSPPLPFLRLLLCLALTLLVCELLPRSLWPIALPSIALFSLFLLLRSMDAAPPPPSGSFRASTVAPMLPPLEFHRTLEPREECVSPLSAP